MPILLLSECLQRHPPFSPQRRPGPKHSAPASGLVDPRPPLALLDEPRPNLAERGHLEPAWELPFVRDKHRLSNRRPPGYDLTDGPESI